MTHITKGGKAVQCPGPGCRICRLLDRDGPHYREDYRRLFHPEEFGEPPARASIPLAGDLVAALAARVGADRAARWIASKLGVDCGCAARREALNRLDAKLRKYLSKDA